MTRVEQSIVEIDDGNLDGRLYSDIGNLPEGFALVKNDENGNAVMVFFDAPMNKKAKKFVERIQEQAISTHIHFPEIEE